ncbi:MAG: DUF1934 family protein [Erysipelothrix sp.]|nr:DUF1934 family protein [Erysipelothrix sp.]
MNSEIRLKVVQEDLMQNTKETIFLGKAIKNIRELETTITYKELGGHDVQLIISKDSGSLSRKHQEETMINFDINQVVSAYVKTQAGLLLMEVKTEDIVVENDQLLIAYKLLQEQNVIGSFLLKMEW